MIEIEKAVRLEIRNLQKRIVTLNKVLKVLGGKESHGVRRMSKAGRMRIAAAQRARWAKAKKQKA